jgi:dTDP-4-dehydrorhamnose 3,5-epimerase
MKFEQTSLPGACVVNLDRLEDERGFFARTFCREEFAAHGLTTDFVQSSVSFNKRKGTLRGLHFQKKPHEEAKLVRCTMGAVYDVIVDLRPGSPTVTRWFGVELSATNRKALYVPKGFAHGFITLINESEVLYQISAEFHTESAAGVRWNDPAFAIEWPIEAVVMSERDRSYPDYRA